MFGRKAIRNPAIPLPWRGDRTPPPGFDRPPTTDELAARRKNGLPALWEPNPTQTPNQTPQTPTVGVSTGTTDRSVVESSTRTDARHAGPTVEEVDEVDEFDVEENWDDINESNDDAGASGDGRVDPSVGLSVFRGRATTMRFGSSRIAVIGDVGGVLSCFNAVLKRLGVVGDTIPEDLVIVQLGDLVGGRGDDAALVQRVDRLMHTNAGSWIQLVGNWEARHLPGWAWFGTQREQHRLDASSAETLRRWWDGGEMRIAVALETAAGQTLITHAGLTGGLWHELGCARNAESAAQTLNEAALYAPGVIGRAGEMMSRMQNGEIVKGRRLDAGPVWASASELWTSWSNEQAMPFNQVVGHTSPWYFNKQQWSPHVEGTDPVLLEQSVPDAVLRHVTHTHRCGATIKSIDCGIHPAAPINQLRPFHVPEGRALR